VRLLAKRLLLAIGLAASGGCSSGWVELSPIPPASYTKLGPAEGEACATYVMALPWHQLLAFGSNDRLVRARAAALASVPDSTGLVNVTLQERWAWWGLFSRRCAVVRGDAIR
jgi:hypothetical protein